MKLSKDKKLIHFLGEGLPTKLRKMSAAPELSCLEAKNILYHIDQYLEDNGFEIYPVKKGGKVGVGNGVPKAAPFGIGDSVKIITDGDFFGRTGIVSNISLENKGLEIYLIMGLVVRCSFDDVVPTTLGPIVNHNPEKTADDIAKENLEKFKTLGVLEKPKNEKPKETIFNQGWRWDGMDTFAENRPSMFTPWQKCPVCEGEGWRYNPEYGKVDEGGAFLKVPFKIDCHVCQKSGVIPMKREG